MRLLALDPASLFGWALFVDGVVVDGGVWDFRPRRGDRPGVRFTKLEGELQRVGWVDHFVYEDVKGHKGTGAAHIYGGLVATITAWCERADPPIPYLGIHTGHVKKLATGNGNADKAAMVEAAAERWPAIDILDDNHADALWIGVAGLRELGLEAA